MNILVIAHYRNFNSPTANFVHDQVRTYKKLGHNVLLLVPTPIGKKDYKKKRFSKLVSLNKIDGVDYIFIRFLSLSNPGERFFNARFAIISVSIVAMKHIQLFEPDIIHAHTFGLNSILGSWLARRLNKKIVVTTHGSDTTLLHLRGDDNRLRRLANKCDRIVCVSSKLAKILAECGISVKIDVIPNGFKSEYVHDVKKKSLTSNFKETPIIVNQTCNLVESKQVDITIKAFRIINQKYPNSKLYIVGDGPLKNSLISLRDSLGLTANISFWGMVSNKDALELMGKSHFFVMPSINEGFGVVYIEAMASGCITIGTQNEGIRDIITDNVNGFLIMPGDYTAIANVVIDCIENPDNMEKILKDGKKTAFRYTWENNAIQYIDIFEEIFK